MRHMIKNQLPEPCALHWGDGAPWRDPKGGGLAASAPARQAPRKSRAPLSLRVIAITVGLLQVNPSGGSKRRNKQARTGAGGWAHAA